MADYSKPEFINYNYSLGGYIHDATTLNQSFSVGLYSDTQTKVIHYANRLGDEYNCKFCFHKIMVNRWDHSIPQHFDHTVDRHFNAYLQPFVVGKVVSYKDLFVTVKVNNEIICFIDKAEYEKIKWYDFRDDMYLRHERDKTDGKLYITAVNKSSTVADRDVYCIQDSSSSQGEARLLNKPYLKFTCCRSTMPKVC